MSRHQSFHLKTEIVFGTDALDRLEAYKGKRVGIVTDAFMSKSGALDRLRARLSGCSVAVFDEAIPEPPLSTVSDGARKLGEFDPEVVIALGGGSPIDAAKAIVAILRGMRPDRQISLVAVPTTSGTGSEVTTFAVISDPDRGMKIPLVDDALVPDVALLDSEFTRTVPPSVTADTGMDVMTHAFEALVAKGANFFTEAMAEKALALCHVHLPRVVANGEDMVSREAMHHASCMAGVAFAAAGLGLNHGIAHALGGRLHLPHGRLNAILLPHILAYNAGVGKGDSLQETTATRYAAIAARFGLNATSTRDGVCALVREIVLMNQSFGIPTSLQEMKVDMDAYAAMEDDLITVALNDASTAANPRIPTPDDVRALLRAVGR